MPLTSWTRPSSLVSTTSLFSVRAGFPGRIRHLHRRDVLHRPDALQHRRHTDADGYADRDADGYADRDADGYADRDADGHADRDADGHADRDADGHADRDADGHADRDADGTPTPVPGAKATTTTLSVIQVPLPFGLGGFAIPIANVGPDDPAGTVQFKDGTHNLGDPVRVFGGVAVGPFAFLPAGHHSVTAVFTPTNPAKFKPSTSNTVNFTF